MPKLEEKLYSNIVWKHSRDPQNRGVLQNPDGVGESRFPQCGDHLIVQLQLESGILRDVRFLAKACAPVVAAASLATTQVIGKSIEEARALSVIRLDKDLGGLPGPKRHALWMFLEALSLALDEATNSITIENVKEGPENEIQPQI